MTNLDKKKNKPCLIHSKKLEALLAFFERPLTSRCTCKRESQ